MTMEGRRSLCFVVFLCSTVTFVLSSVNFNRKLTTECYCPCQDICSHPNNGSYTNLYYTRADGRTDTVHYVTSTTGYPGILVARLPLDANIEIDLQEYLSDDPSKSIKFDNTEYYVYTLQFVRLLEYNDVNDDANLSSVANDPSLWTVYDLSTDVPWTNASVRMNLTANEVVFTITNTSKANTNSSGGFVFKGNGSMTITVHMNALSGRTQDLPRLQYTANSSLVEVTVDGLTPMYAQSRLALELVVVTSDAANSSKAETETAHSIDDEYTPGVFSITDILTGAPDHQATSAFLQFKPVCYRSTKRAVKSATKVKSYPLEGQEAGLRLAGKSSLALAYFGAAYTHQMAVGVNVSFGLSKDKFYTGTNYTTWLFSVGYGLPPVEEVSTIVLTIITVGFGTPVLLILFGGIGVCVVRSKKPRETSAYTAIN